MSDSVELYKTACPNCPSSDAFGVYDDGHGHCYSCGAHVPNVEGMELRTTRRRPMASDLIAPGEAKALPARRLTEETCRKWGYTITSYRGEPVQVANYKDTAGNIVGQKLRFLGKKFSFLGDAKKAGLYGQHLWRDGGRRVVITEGEIDALSVSQAFGNKWPVVSLPQGAQSAPSAIRKALPWLLGFEEVVLMFDDDEAGREATAAVAPLLPPGRCKIAKLPFKDASEALVARQPQVITDAVFGAKTWRPDGIVTIADIRDRTLLKPEVGLPWFTPAITKLTHGRRPGEIYAFGAGTGVGKTDWLTEQMCHDIAVLREPIGVFALEQAPTETLKRLAGKYAGRRFFVDDGDWEVGDLAAAIDALEGSGKLFLYDSFGATDWTIIQNTIRYLAHSEGVRLFYLDHLTALAAAEEKEREALERIMAEMGALVKELNIVIHLVSHLATPEGRPHEEGGRVMIRHFKGSRAIGFWCHYMFGLERDQQHASERLRGITTFRVLKDRYTGQATGSTIYFEYDANGGRLIALDYDPFADEDQEENVYAAFANAPF